MIELKLSKEVSGEEIFELRKAAGYGDGDSAMWTGSVQSAVCVATARDKEKEDLLVGVGFVAGNNRHVQLVDLVVHPDYRKQGIGGRLFDIRRDYCLEKKIPYIGLTYDQNSPWLKDFYTRHGFEEINFAMWHKSSLKNLGL
jgi:GNAT superfamily N-acetyltransferase